MSEEIDYEKVGLKCGLEIHQQLDTEKLFCNCPSLIRKDDPEFFVERKLHAVAGESGEVDKAAEYQAALKKTYSYQGYSTTCLVEFDESPPREINSEALRIATQISILLNAKIIPITQIMRKIVIDGSNTSGFQRTVLFARDGFVETSYGKVRIDTICLEEDSARIVSKEKDKVIFRLDRLGIPLIEIATAPDIKNPEQAKEVALYIGNVLRSCKVKRGLGTIRQDVNVSVKKGKRVEIKGVQNPELIKKAVEEEAKRQIGLIEKKKKFESEVRKVLLDGKTEFLRPMPGASRMYPETDLPLLRIHRDFINHIKKNLPKLRQESERELKRKGLSQESIKMILSGYLDDFEELLKIYSKDPELIAKMLTVWRREISTKSKKTLKAMEEIINFDVLSKILTEVKKGMLRKEYVRQIFSDLVKGIPLEDSIRREESNFDEIEEKIISIIKSKPGLSEKAYMGLAMKEFKGKISGSEVIKILKKHF
ncbi:MAG: Glu-tRNA(Gln) amidotransferase subunit GatE [Candidatus Pacearchaeota archaeon]